MRVTVPWRMTVSCTGPGGASECCRLRPLPELIDLPRVTASVKSG